MLSKAPIRPDPVRPQSVLHDDLAVDPLVPRRDERRVRREQPRVDPDLRDVERVRAREESQPVHEAPKGAEGAVEDVRAVAELRGREVRGAHEVAGLADERGDADDLRAACGRASGDLRERSGEVVVGKLATRLGEAEAAIGGMLECGWGLRWRTSSCSKIRAFRTGRRRGCLDRDMPRP